MRQQSCAFRQVANEKKKENKMDASLASGSSSFLERATRILERVEHRCALTVEDEERVYRLRCSAYSNQGPVRRRSEGRDYDEGYDNSPNHYNMMTFLDGEFVGAFRIHVGSGSDAILPSRASFPDILLPILREDRVVVDLTRIAVKLEYARKFPELPCLTIRAAWLAAQHFDADVITTTCFADQQTVYARAFGFESLGSPRAALEGGRAIACMALDCRTKRERIENLYPLFRSTKAERRSIYGAAPSLAGDWRRAVSPGRPSRKERWTSQSGGAASP
jgi:hypothetical protein